MENKHCIFCTQLHNNHWIETETQKGNVCNACYDIRSQEKECNVCHHTLPIEDFVTEWGGGYDLPEEMCSECTQEYISDN